MVQYNGLTQREGGESVLDEGVLVGVDAAVVLLQMHMVATVCSAGVYDIRWTAWDGYKLVMDAI